MKTPIAITMGDPAGVGPELCWAMLRDAEITGLCRPVVFGDWHVLRDVAARLGEPWLDSLDRIVPGKLLPGDRPAIVDLGLLGPSEVVPGRVDAVTGRAAYDYIVSAVAAAQTGSVHGIVTSPIHKEAFHAAGVPFPGHTELLADLTKCDRYCMMLTSETISCSLVTTHIGLRDVADQVREDRVLEVIRLTHEALEAWLDRPPRLVVCGLNPHAGEHGLFGRQEEQLQIEPAVRRAKLLGIRVEGPVAPDTAFVPARRAVTDAYVCMYHDQGLIPLKALSFDTAINVTLGLPIRRSSVDHGTALDIAWQGTVDATSMRHAIRWAAKS